LINSGLIEPSLVTNKEVTLFYENSEKDPIEFFILPNGSLFMSQKVLDEVLASSGLEGLAFLLLHELAHIA
jgi:hypothetical protein